MGIRLSYVAPDLVELVDRATDEARRNAAIAAAGFAIKRAGHLDERIGDALERIRAGGVVAKGERSVIEAVAAALDEHSWDVQARMDAGEATLEDYIAASSGARAATCVVFAMDENARTAALEAIYEASAVVEDVGELRAVVVPILTR